MDLPSDPRLTRFNTHVPAPMRKTTSYVERARNVSRQLSFQAKAAKDEAKEDPWRGCAAVSLIVFVFALLRGGRGGASLIPGLDCSQFLYWYLFISNLAVRISA